MFSLDIERKKCHEMSYDLLKNLLQIDFVGTIRIPLFVFLLATGSISITSYNEPVK